MPQNRSVQKEMKWLITNKYSRLGKKDFKTRDDLAGKVILCELCKGLKFDHTTKSYMPKPDDYFGEKDK